MDLLWGRGRTGRLSYALTSVVIVVVLAAAASIGVTEHSLTGERQIADATYAVFGAGAWLSIGNVVRRLHDRGHAGFWFLTGLIPGFGIVLGLYLLFAPGDAGWNRFGTPPKGASGSGDAHQRTVHHAAVDQHAAQAAQNQRYLTDDGTFDADGLFRDSNIDRR